ncbi:hypothetical protein [Mangrovicoccus sp. HB161399]|uniref:hypothetical protein n=1 Tax=Mangrovicoccus sp. HB161399 TaxID=2720392 RepID=UPI001555AFC7|nr:hypothetical protein [Mangrovicoccus sp. HB161399]
MADAANGLVPEHLPFFITGPGQTDTLFTVITVFVIVAVLGIGVFYLHLHSIPDRMAHQVNHTQLQLIGILTLIALLTHSNIFWVIAIIIAAINPPDFVTPLNSMARSLRRLASEPEPAPEEKPAEETAHHV